MGKPTDPGVAGNISNPQRYLDLVQVSQQPETLGHGLNQLHLFGGHARGEEVPGLAGGVEGQQRAEPGVGQRPGPVDDPLQDRIHAQVAVDVKSGLIQTGQMSAQLLDLPIESGDLCPRLSRASKVLGICVLRIHAPDFNRKRQYYTKSTRIPDR